MRAIMTAAELAQHKTGAHGRDYTVSDDGYGDQEAAGKYGWRPVWGWGTKGWDLGDPPYVIIYTRDRAETPELQLRGAVYELQQVVEGDHTQYRFDSAEDRDAAIDYLFLWYAAAQGRSWSPLTWEQLPELDAGTLTVDDEFRGPYRAS